ncbi:Co2+/Mg2+ efflux protein ApaG [Algoriphagus limi]|uniref:Co2+/Mg2+ efflux protein ApaG n=1 Tax=Algoriphagus limi TaxID=2975273 RepID=A0ABT2G8M9_9BACT|nr:Co2+/Mg2+ efflux protein ApaG [Algoriphagus limi]MCS5490297.1 Co2+/Mg2+ efflux protein ApaG [Algoriphagus limi]
MVTAITEGIEVSVEVTYQAEFSSPLQHHYVFTYKVTIHNRSDITVQLLRRRWEISDAAETRKVVEGDGVVGQQPTLEPGQSHSYVSGCNLRSGLGKMKGWYTMQKVYNEKEFEVVVPEFQMISNIFHN